MNYRNTKMSAEKRKAIMDAMKRRHERLRKLRRTADAKKFKSFAKFRVTDSYNALKKRIKDDMAETETTADAVDVVIEALNDAPAEQVVAAAIEVLGETIDVLQSGDEDVEDED